jgi:ParB family transcriptional regulator, chromosome partitioning protein
VKTEEPGDRMNSASKALWAEKVPRPLNVQTRPESGQLVDVPLDSLEDSPFQVKQYDDARVRDLAETIRRQGLLQPATVRPINGKYQLISGHARRAALRLLRDKVATSPEERARYSTIRCVLLLGVDDARAAALTAIENLQRDDGTPLEQALMVAKARDAGGYQNIPETASALGLPLGRVRQYLQLAEAPAVLQRAVAPGVMVARDDGGRERVSLPVTSVLAVRPYYDFLFENRLAELRGESAVQRRREERRGRVDDSIEARQRETARRQELAAEFAAERTERLLVRAARSLWTVGQVQAHVRSATRPGALGSGDEAAADSTVDGNSASVPRLYEDKGGRLTIWPATTCRAASTDRASLAAKLRTLLGELEG